LLALQTCRLLKDGFLLSSFFISKVDVEAIFLKDKKTIIAQ